MFGDFGMSKVYVDKVGFAAITLYGPLNLGINFATCFLFLTLVFSEVCLTLHIRRLVDRALRIMLH